MQGDKQQSVLERRKQKATKLVANSLFGHSEYSFAIYGNCDPCDIFEIQYPTALYVISDNLMGIGNDRLFKCDILRMIVY
jgi:hypothetical protein